MILILFTKRYQNNVSLMYRGSVFFLCIDGYKDFEKILGRHG